MIYKTSPLFASLVFQSDAALITRYHILKTLLHHTTNTIHITLVKDKPFYKDTLQFQSHINKIAALLTRRNSIENPVTHLRGLGSWFGWKMKMIPLLVIRCTTEIPPLIISAALEDSHGETAKRFRMPTSSLSTEDST